MEQIKSFCELSTKELYQILRLRNEVFVAEQACAYQDCDGKDLHAWRFMMKEAGLLMGYLRVLPKGLSFEEVSIGRLVVDPSARGRGLAKKMMQDAIAFIKHDLHENKIRISAQAYLISFYEELGFTVASDVYLEDDIPHVEMLFESHAVGLVIVDVQRAMFECDGGVYNGEAVLSRIETLLKTARESGVPVIFIQHTEQSGEYGKGVETWKIHERLQPRPQELVVEKNYWDAFQKTELESVLKSLGLRRLLVVGMQTEYCMDTTIRNAFSRGYQLMGVKGCHTTFDSPVLPAVDVIHHHERIWDGRFLTMLTVEEAQAVLIKQGLV